MICAACGGVTSFDFARCPACGAPAGGVESADDDTPMRPVPPREITRKVPEAVVRNLARGEKASGSTAHYETRRVPRELLEQLARSGAVTEDAAEVEVGEDIAAVGGAEGEPDEELEFRPPPPSSTDANPFDVLDESLTLPFEPPPPVVVPPRQEQSEDAGDPLPIEVSEVSTDEESPFDHAPPEPPLPRAGNASPLADVPQRRTAAIPPPLPPAAGAPLPSRPHSPPAPSPPPPPAVVPVSAPIAPRPDRAERTLDPPPPAPLPVIPSPGLPRQPETASAGGVPASMPLAGVAIVVPPGARRAPSRRRLALAVAGLAALAAGTMALLWAVWLGRTAAGPRGVPGTPRPPSAAVASPHPAVSPAPPEINASGSTHAAAVPEAPQGPCPAGSLLFHPPHASRREAYCVDAYEFPGRGQVPRTDVTRDQAAALCAARGERLCSPREWEAACRGPGETSYPYGDSFLPQRCNTALRDGSDPRPLAPAGAYPTCRSPSGAFDMSGNAGEWDAAGRVRGGSSRAGGHAVRCSQRDAAPPGGSAAWIGFRCCANPILGGHAGGG